MSNEEIISPTPLAKSFNLVNNLSELEQGRFYKVNKDGSFVKKNDGLDSIPSKDLASIKNNTYLKKITDIVFSTYGLVIILILIIIAGILLGLIPVFLHKDNKTNVLVINQEQNSITSTGSVTTEYFTFIKSTSTTSTTTSSTTTTTITSTSTSTSSTSTTTSTITTTITTTSTSTPTITTTTTTITSTTTTTEEPSTSPFVPETTIETTTTSTSTTSTTTTALETTESTTILTTILETTVQEITTTQQEITTVTTLETTVKTCEIDPDPKSIIPSDYNSNECPTRSIHSPKFITLTESYNFDYPINQVVVCLESKLVLKCPQTQLIHIYSAYYGIQGDTNTLSCDRKSSFHEICYFDLTYSNLTTSCEKKNTCEITVNVGSFGDPCINSKNKQLFVQYQCLDISNYEKIDLCDVNQNKSSICPQIKNGQNEKISCTSEPFTINCTIGQVIKILCAFYGLDPNLRCSGAYYYGAPSACYSKQSYDLIYENCDGKQNCTFSDETNTKYDIGFNEVCPGFLNMLLIQWECVPEYKTTEVYQSTIPSLPICKTTPFINATCTSNHSPYVPLQLTNSTDTFFSYPIYQQIVCQGSTLVLTCPSEMVIHIFSAYFGLQEYTKSTFCTGFSDSETPYMLYIADSFKIINLTCEYKTKCALKAFPVSMGGTDLNSAYLKQLVVQYQCVNSIVLKNQINQCEVNKQIPLICPSVQSTSNEIVYETTVCEGFPLSLRCTNNKRIKVICSFFGIHPSLTNCEIPALSFKPVCYFNSSHLFMTSWCNSKTSCTLDAVTTRTFSNLDPCIGLKKALFVQWKCE